MPATGAADVCSISHQSSIELLDHRQGLVPCSRYHHNKSAQFVFMKWNELLFIWSEDSTVKHLWGGSQLLFLRHGRQHLVRVDRVCVCVQCAEIQFLHSCGLRSLLRSLWNEIFVTDRIEAERKCNKYLLKYQTYGLCTKTKH